MYEAAGTIWMFGLQTDSDATEQVSLNQLESAMWMWSEERLAASGTSTSSRRYTFDVILQAIVDDPTVAQPLAHSGGVLMVRLLQMLCGRAIILAWYHEMGEALRKNEEDRVLMLLEPALSVPIRLRLNPDKDTCMLVQLAFSESLLTSSAASGADSFWKFASQIRQLSVFRDAISSNASLPNMEKALGHYGFIFGGKKLIPSDVKALKSLDPYVCAPACATAYSLMEPFCPELMQPTLLMRCAQLSAARESGDTEASGASLVFIFDCLRVWRLTGEHKADNVYTLSKITGQENKKNTSDCTFAFQKEGRH